MEARTHLLIFSIPESCHGFAEVAYPVLQCPVASSVVYLTKQPSKAPPANSEYWQIKMASENREVPLLRDHPEKCGRVGYDDVATCWHSCKKTLFCIFCIMSVNCPPQKTLSPLIGRQSDEASPESPDINPVTSHFFLLLPEV